MIKRMLLSFIVILAAAITYTLNMFNDYEEDGELTVSVLEKPVTVIRDELGIPYIYAETIADALRAQGFITGQNRLYQAEIYKHIAQGRLAELFGERAAKTDILMRAVGIQQIAAQQVALLNDDATLFYQSYVEGINAYIETQQHEYPFSLTLLGLKPEPWTLQDIIAIQYFQIWGSSANWRTELLAQRMIDTLGSELANEISQVSINPDDEVIVEANFLNEPQLSIRIDQDLLNAFPDPLNAASNAWASSGKKSANGSAIFSNSPHIDARTLPGFWQPMGIFTPQVRAIGATAPGTPSFGIARTSDIAFGATNGNSDGVDLYIESLDPNRPDHYLEGKNSLPLSIRREVILIKDKKYEGGYRQKTLRIRSTSRGPLISDLGINVSGNHAISLRWATVDAMSDSLGMEELLLSKNIDQARQALEKTVTPLSYIIVDSAGDIARISTGRVPKRIKGDGSKPYLITDNVDNWNGVISAEEMSTDIRPQRNWVGTANHRVVSFDYPYEYSTYFAASWRFRRIKEFMTTHEIVSIDDHWSLINDVKNPMAEKLLPRFLPVLESSDDTAELAAILQTWNLRDERDQAGAAVFQLLFKHFAQITFNDDLEKDLWIEFFDAVYYWQERLVLLMEDNNNHWFDIQNTQTRETRDDIIRLAALAAKAELTERLGDAPANWQWGDILNITFSSPVIPGKAMAEWLGAGTRPMFGSGETLNRGKYLYSSDYEAKYIDSIRFVADMSDSEKVLAVIPGGSSGRYLDPTLHNQTDIWMSDEKQYWWYSDEMIKQHTAHTLTLIP
ncbi:MAG: penicillin acylase family protein [Halioglobus sp.]|nr:penicillin acylase family protein [Halioglobus sp.]